MSSKQETFEHFVVINWGLTGNNSAPGTSGYRSNNPWAKVRPFLERVSTGAEPFAGMHGVVSASPIDRGGSVWLVRTSSIPTISGLAIDEFAEQILLEIESRITMVPGDHLIATYSDGAGNQGVWIKNG
jgi:hypothetical protein